MGKTFTLLDRDGACRLRDKIVAYWRERGAEIEVTFEAEPFQMDARCAPVHPRSNLVNGMPPKSAYRTEEHAR